MAKGTNVLSSLVTQSVHIVDTAIVHVGVYLSFFFVKERLYIRPCMIIFCFLLKVP